MFARYCYIPRSKKQPSSYMSLHHAPLINVVDQCMPASEPKWLFFEGPCKQSGVTTLNWGDRGQVSFLVMNVTNCGSQYIDPFLA